MDGSIYRVTNLKNEAKDICVLDVSLQVRLIDMMRQKILLNEYQIEAGTHQKRIEFGAYDLPDGMYLLNLSNGRWTESQAIILY